MYKEWLDQLWSIFGEDRIIFGSDWPQSESVEYNSYPNVIGVARAYVSSKSQAAMEKVFWKNSTKPYRWVQRDPSQRRTLSAATPRDRSPAANSYDGRCDMPRIGQIKSPLVGRDSIRDRRQSRHAWPSWLPKRRQRDGAFQ